MLVLTRKHGESVQIGDNITVKVIKTGRNTVKIGIDAPREVPVKRSELCVTENSVSARRNPPGASFDAVVGKVTKFARQAV